MKTLQISPESYEAMKAATEEKKNPLLTLARHAGWKLVNVQATENKERGGFVIVWNAANSVTARIVTFDLESDEPEGCYETAADELIMMIGERLGA